MPRPRCICALGQNPNCFYDHDAEEARNRQVQQRHADSRLADLEWVRDWLSESLVYRLKPTLTRDVDTTDAPHLQALGSKTSTDEELLAAAKAIRAGLQRVAFDEASMDADEEIAQLEREEERTGWAA